MITFNIVLGLNFYLICESVAEKAIDFEFVRNDSIVSVRAPGVSKQDISNNRHKKFRLHEGKLEIKVNFNKLNYVYFSIPCGHVVSKI